MSGICIPCKGITTNHAYLKINVSKEPSFYNTPIHFSNLLIYIISIEKQLRFADN